MTKLLLHVGSHKTGTTSIQHCLGERREYLESRGIYYPDSHRFFGGKTEAHHKVAHALSSTTALQLRQLAAFRRELLEKAADFECIVLSAEPFYRHLAHASSHDDEDDLDITEEHALRKEYVISVGEYFADFETEVLLYLRRPDRFAESIYKSKVVNSLFSGGFSRSLRKKTFRYDYRFQVDLFAEYVGAVRVRGYERMARKGLLESFFEELGIPAPGIDCGKTLRRSVSNRAALWIDRSKQEQSFTLKDVRNRWLFALEAGHGDLFGSNEMTSLWDSLEQRDRFCHRYADDLREIEFPPLEPDIAPRSTWDDSSHLRAEAEYESWRDRNRDRLALRARNKLLPYMPDSAATDRSWVQKRGATFQSLLGFDFRKMRRRKRKKRT